MRIEVKVLGAHHKDVRGFLEVTRTHLSYLPSKRSNNCHLSEPKRPRYGSTSGEHSSRHLQAKKTLDTIQTQARVSRSYSGGRYAAQDQRSERWKVSCPSLQGALVSCSIEEECRQRLETWRWNHGNGSRTC